MRIACLRFVAICGTLVIGMATADSWLWAEPIATEEKGAPAENAEGKDEDITNAVARFRMRDFDGALNLLKEATGKNNDLPPAQVLMAHLFAQANVPAAVRAALEKAVQESPEDPEAYIFMGEIASRERRATEASLLFDKAAEILSKFTKSEKRKAELQIRIYKGLASVAEMREDWAAAQKQFEAWLAADPKNIVAIQQIAHCLYLQKNADGALEKLREAAKIEPDLLTPEAVLAQFCVQANDREEAKKWVTAALAAAPKDTRIHLFAAQLALDNQQFDEAKTEADATLKLDPKSLDAKIVLGVVALFQKNYKDAEMYFESAHLQVPTNFQAGNYLALALVEQKDEAKKRKALEYAEANLRQFQKSPDAIATYGWVLYKLGRLDEAEQVLRSAASSGNVKPETAFYLARLAVDRGRQPEAKQLLEAALSSGAVFPQREEAQALMGQLK